MDLRLIVFYMVFLLVCPTFAAESVIKGPDTVRPNQFFVLNSGESKADFFMWIPDPKLEEVQKVECEEQYGLAIKNKGQYLFYLVVSDGDGIDVSSHYIDVGNSTPPPPPPPDDKFDNLSQRLSVLAKGLNKKDLIIKRYGEAVTMLKGEVKSLAEVALETRQNIESDLGSDLNSWQDLRDEINRDIGSRWPISRETMVEYYGAIIKGLKI